MTNLLLTSIPYFKEGESLLPVEHVGRTYDPVQSSYLLSDVIIVVSFHRLYCQMQAQLSTGNRNNEIQSAGQIQGAFATMFFSFMLIWISQMAHRKGLSLYCQNHLCQRSRPPTRPI